MSTNDNRFKNLQVFLVCLQPDRLKLFERRSDEDHPRGIEFSEPVAQFEHSGMRPLICIIYDVNRLVKYLAVGHRGYGGGTGLTQLELTSVETVGIPFPVNKLKDRLIRRFENLAAEAFHSGGLLTLKTSHAVLEALVAEYSQAKGVIEIAINCRPNPISDLNSEQRFGFQQQQDAVLMSLQFAGLDRKEFLHADFNLSAAPKSYLEGLPQSYFREDAMLISDHQTFPGFAAIKKYVQNGVRFTDGKVCLSVLLVNREPLEELTGADLIYYNETFKSFVMVQYKAMEKEDNDEVFRLPNEGLDKEVEKMKRFFKELSVEENKPSNTPGSFRFDQNPFFLKFCPRIVRQPDDIELIPGLYFPLEYWNRLRSSPDLDGPKGGKVLRFDNAGRYLNNTEFTTFVSKAWVGTSIDQSAILENIIRTTLENGRPITIAQVKQLPDESGSKSGE